MHKDNVPLAALLEIDWQKGELVWRSGFDFNRHLLPGRERELPKHGGPNRGPFPNHGLSQNGQHKTYIDRAADLAENEIDDHARLPVSATYTRPDN
jgi:hypothetical protein